MKKYDFCHIFFKNSPVFTTSTIDIIEKINGKFKNLYIVKEELGDEYFDYDIIVDPLIDDISELNKYNCNCKYLVFHSLGYSNAQVIELSDDVLRKTVWCVWGHDLYRFVHKNRTIKQVIKLILRKYTKEYKALQKIKLLRGIAVGYEGDEKTLLKLLGKNINIYNALYPSGYFLSDVDEALDGCKRGNSDGKVHIMLGHSAFEYENHLNYIRRLEHYTKEAITVHIPLSYGNQEYISQIKDEVSRSKISDKVLYYEKFMEPQEYIRLLSQMDIVILDFEKQAAFGNIILLLYLGKKLFLSKSGVMYKGLKDMGLEVFDCSLIGKVTLSELTESFSIDKNMQYGKNHLDESVITKQWLNMMNSLLEEKKYE